VLNLLPKGNQLYAVALGYRDTSILKPARGNDNDLRCQRVLRFGDERLHVADIDLGCLVFALNDGKVVLQPYSEAKCYIELPIIYRVVPANIRFSGHRLVYGGD
jgi:hypothetical protein